MAGVFKEPLLHFLLAGAVLFGAYAGLKNGANTAETSKQPGIHLTAEHVQWLAESWTRQWRRSPTHEELRGLISDHLDEQLLAREARAMGLDDNDIIVQRRLAQKMTFFIEGTLVLGEPSQDELEQFYQRLGDRFRPNGRISLVQIYFDPQRRADAHSDATKALKALSAAGTAPPIEEIGDRTLIQAEFRDETAQALSSALGPHFARAVFSLKPGEWSGPIESGYGLHLVRVSSVQEPQLPPLSDVRARVMEEWKNEQENLAKERYLAELRKKYGVVADEIVGSLVGPAVPLEGIDQ
jgi:hypothetical protein